MTRLVEPETTVIEKSSGDENRQQELRERKSGSPRRHQEPAPEALKRI